MKPDTPGTSLLFAEGVEAGLRGLQPWWSNAPYHSVWRIPVGSCAVVVLREMATERPDWEFAVNRVDDFNITIRLGDRKNHIQLTLRIGGKSNKVWAGLLGVTEELSVLRVTTGQQVYDFIRAEIQRRLNER